MLLFFQILSAGCCCYSTYQQSLCCLPQYMIFLVNEPAYVLYCSAIWGIWSITMPHWWLSCWYWSKRCMNQENLQAHSMNMHSINLKFLSFRFFLINLSIYLLNFVHSFFQFKIFQCFFSVSINTKYKKLD